MREMTEPELKLWNILRNRALLGMKFRRQVPIGNYIADFCCLDRRLIVELDGGQHAEQGSCGRIEEPVPEPKRISCSAVLE